MLNFFFAFPVLDNRKKGERESERKHVNLHHKALKPLGTINFLCSHNFLL